MQCVNSLAPFIINGKLKALMRRTEPNADKYIVNVSAMEGAHARPAHRPSPTACPGLGAPVLQMTASGLEPSNDARRVPSARLCTCPYPVPPMASPKAPMRRTEPNADKYIVNVSAKEGVHARPTHRPSPTACLRRGS